MMRIEQKHPILATRFLPRLVVATFVTGALLCGTRAADAAGTPEQQCAAGKNKTAGKYAACRENAEAKLAAGGEMSKYTDALDKCEMKFSTAWQKLEGKALAASASCPADDAVIQGQTDAYTRSVATLVAGMRFEGNLDGTVTDHETGLQWERKQNLDGTVNLADPHDADNTYTWNANFLGTTPNGTAFTDFLPQLNGGSIDGVTLTGCFAGHCDWRLPTVVELQTILEDPFPCGTSPCIAPVFGPTIAFGYWSATTNASVTSFAWVVYFSDGDLGNDSKINDNYVRAVRGGP